MLNVITLICQEPHLPCHYTNTDHHWLYAVTCWKPCWCPVPCRSGSIQTVLLWHAKAWLLNNGLSAVGSVAAGGRTAPLNFTLLENFLFRFFLSKNTQCGTENPHLVEFWDIIEILCIRISCVGNLHDCRAATWSLTSPKVPFLNTWSLMSPKSQKVVPKVPISV